jgi:hypothetical protein
MCIHLTDVQQASEDTMSQVLGLFIGLSERSPESTFICCQTLYSAPMNALTTEATNTVLQRTAKG